MRVCLFEDRSVLDLEPLSLTRPAFDLLCGLSSLAEKQRSYFVAATAGALVRPHLADVCRINYPDLAVNDLAWLRAGPVALVNARWLPPAGTAVRVDEPCVALVDDEVAYAVVGPEHLAYCSANTMEDCVAAWKATLPQRTAGGRLFRHLWEMVEESPRQAFADWKQSPVEHRPAAAPLALQGPGDRLAVSPTARVEPFVVADTTAGPVVIGPGAVVTSFSRLEGPCFVGAGTHLLGARVRSCTIGPHCRIGGEVECSVIQGHSNKAHDGFLGHAYVGEWVNLGAGTQCSDLRNDYGEVRVAVGGVPVRTGQTKVGCFVGDHTKTAIGTLLNTGTSAGAFCQLLPGGLLPRYLPSFASWWNGAIADRADVAALLSTAATVMGRRGRQFTNAHAALYRTVFEQTAAERRRTVREADVRRLRRSA
jgi:UDP-N-acetylglucosamine diphosphorylase / glucose-1-phosphate thymidylyltransferase / UDP-N-acetylgalactosamine diphosphorylase / glucosamine-1-phosphate N-acetyltransferase / galactosamine-1-phosphate N-acetyltransferase